jgi:hypothetical protein
MRERERVRAIKIEEKALSSMLYEINIGTQMASRLHEINEGRERELSKMTK